MMTCCLRTKFAAQRGGPSSDCAAIAPKGKQSVPSATTKRIICILLFGTQAYLSLDCVAMGGKRIETDRIAGTFKKPDAASATGGKLTFARSFSG
jgi:hypothetical protein